MRLYKYPGDNVKVNEYLNRRVELEDVVEARLLAAEQAPAIGFRRYIVSSTTPFTLDDLVELSRDAPLVVRRLVPEFEVEYARRGWKLAPRLDRVYVNERSRNELGWQPRYDFGFLIGPWQ